MLLYEGMHKGQTLYGNKCRFKFVLKYGSIYTVNIIFTLHSYKKKQWKIRIIKPILLLFLVEDVLWVYWNKYHYSVLRTLLM